MGREWIELKETGKLYLEKILVTFDVPILFVCVDYENRKYLCLNVDDQDMKYVIAETDAGQLVDMLTNIIPMETVFRNSAKGQLIIAEYNAVEDVIISQVIAANIVSSALLPQSGAMFELSDNIIKDYIEHLRRQIIKVEIECFSDEQKILLNNCPNALYFEVDELKVVECPRLLLEHTRERCRYDVNINGKMIA